MANNADHRIPQNARDRPPRPSLIPKHPNKRTDQQAHAWMSDTRRLPFH
jgi:hypothetical protein